MSTQVTLGPPRVLNGPVPVPPRYNLLTVASFIEDLDPHWMAGGAVYPYSDIEDGATHDGCATGTFREKLTGGSIARPEFGAFTVYVAGTCTARGLGDDEAFRQCVEVSLNALEPALVEREFAQGIAMPNNPYLAGPGVNVLGDYAPVEAMAQLELAIGRTGKMGVIHGDPGTTTAWAAALVLEKQGDGLRTIGNGTPVVSGYGYIDTIPLGQGTDIDDGTGWAFATGPVQFRRSEMIMMPGTLAEALDRQSNTVTYRAERHYLVDWDTELQAAVLVERT